MFKREFETERKRSFREILNKCGQEWCLTILEIASQEPKLFLIFILRYQLLSYFVSWESNGSDKLYCPINCECCPHIETSQMIFCANQLTGFYMRATLAINGLNIFDKFMNCSPASEVHLQIYLYQFSISSSQSCLGDSVERCGDSVEYSGDSVEYSGDSVEYCSFFRKPVSKGGNLLLMNSSLCLYIILSKYFGNKW